jgi:hypothetical protein
VVNHTRIIHNNGFTVNPLKCEWCVPETDWLGCWLTPTGIKPWHKKIKPLLNLDVPKTMTQVQSFNGAVTFYRDFWHKRLHILAPLTAIIGKNNQKKPFEWTTKCDHAFKEAKALLAADFLLRYLDPNLLYHIYTDASNLQFSSVIMQQDAPVTFFSHKLTDVQTCYSTIENELLSIYETLREYRPFLLGTEIHVHTDHKLGPPRGKWSSLIT